MNTQSHFIQRQVILFVLTVTVLAVVVPFLHVTRHEASTNPETCRISGNPRVHPAALQEVSNPEAAAPWNSTYGKLPISFEANSGHYDMRVKFTARGQG